MKARECGMDAFFKLCQVIMKKITDFGGISFDEFLILRALLWVNVNVDIQKKDAHRKLKDNLLSLLTQHVAMLRPSSGIGPMLIMQKLLLLLPSLREANIILRKMWKEIKGEINLKNKLLIELISH